MNDINNGYDRHLDPPDSDEAIFCEYCGQEMELIPDYEQYAYLKSTYYKCMNQFCPEKFDIKCGTTVIEMANHLAEVEQELLDLKIAYKQLLNVAKERLTQSQSKGE
jgi:hypothetical protein